MIVDPSYSAEGTSDESALVVGYKSDYDDNGKINLNVVDASHGRFKGIALAREILRLIVLWQPYRIRVERQGPGAYDLLRDVILLLAKMDNIAIRGDIGFFNPRSTKRAKAERIRKLQELLECDPVTLRIYCPRIFESLLVEAENFAFESDTNLEREDGLLDCISLMCFRGEL